MINLLQLEIEFLGGVRVRMQPIYIPAVFQVPAILSRTLPVSISAVYRYL